MCKACDICGVGKMVVKTCTNETNSVCGKTSCGALAAIDTSSCNCTVERPAGHRDYERTLDGGYNAKYKAIAVVKCNAGYGGGGTVACKADGGWTALLPCTKATACGKLRVFDGGVQDMEDSRGTLLMVGCNAGFKAGLEVLWGERSFRGYQVGPERPQSCNMAICSNCYDVCVAKYGKLARLVPSEIPFLSQNLRLGLGSRAAGSPPATTQVCSGHPSGAASSVLGTRPRSMARASAAATSYSTTPPTPGPPPPSHPPLR